MVCSFICKTAARSNMDKFKVLVCSLVCGLSTLVSAVDGRNLRVIPVKYDLSDMHSHLTGASLPSMGSPSASMIGGGNGSPLLAATYYFNPSVGSSNRRGGSPPRFAGGELPLADVYSGASVSARVAEDNCRAADGRDGTCYDAVRCIEQNGIPMGRCGEQNSVCCIFERSCGGLSSERYTYFRNPGFPSPHDREEMCKVRVERKDAGICQMRLDFTTFDIARPREGNCSQDMLVVSGQNENNLIPKICGVNTGHHFYVDVDESGMVSLQVMMVGSYRRRFDIKVTQIPCHSPMTAPSHCLQYLAGTTGNIKSFNYDELDPAHQGYPNDLDYTVCLRKEPGFCSVSYELADAGSAPFGVGLVSAAAGAATGPVLQAECPDDYLVIGGVRVCSGRLPGGNLPTTTVPSRGRGNATLYTPVVAPVLNHGLITDSTSGPLFVRFVSNGAYNARGFNLIYKQNPCK